jgi:pectin methylesterase-like acyl-CoA thioesterase
VKLDTSHLDVRKLKTRKRKKKRNGDATIVIEHLQLSMDVEFMNVHVRVKSSTNHLRRSLEHVIVVDVQVIIRQSVMQELTQMEMTWSKNVSSYF